jgi:hypothetical protein
MKKKLSVLFAIVLFLGGCASNTGIVKISDDTYLSAKQETMAWSGSTIKVKLYQEANDFCAKMGKKFVQVSNTSVDARYDQFAGAEIQFKCE